MNTGEAPGWLHIEIITGLQQLLLLCLSGTPAAETFEGTARAWADAFWHSPKAWDKDLDAPRIAAAFRTIACQLERFPTPKAVMEAMPKRPEPKKLPQPPISEKQKQENLKKIAEFGRQL